MIQKLLVESALIIHIIVIIIITMIIASIFNYYTKKYIKRNIRTKLMDPTSLVFVKKFLIAIIYIIGLSFAFEQIPAMKIVGHSLLAGAGIFSLVAGLASQQALSNIMSGFLIIIFKPFRIHNRISFGTTTSAIVEEINLRHVVLRDLENNRVVVPNSIISSQVIINMDLRDSIVCRFVTIGIGYSSDIGTALNIMEEEIKKHPFNIDNRTQEEKENNRPEIITRVVSLDSSCVTLKAWAYAKNYKEGFALYCDVLRSIKERFDKENIEIPYNYQNVIIKNENNAVEQPPQIK